jgi:hypothetical protein
MTVSSGNEERWSCVVTRNDGRTNCHCEKVAGQGCPASDEAILPFYTHKEIEIASLAHLAHNDLRYLKDDIAAPSAIPSD